MNEDSNNSNDFIVNIDVRTFTLSAQIVGNILAAKVPSNTAESLAGWFNLIGETLITYATQQQNIESNISKTEENEYKEEVEKIINSFNEELKQVKEELKDIKDKTN